MHAVGDEVWLFDHGFLKKLPVLEVGSRFGTPYDPQRDGDDVRYRLKSHSSDMSWFMASQVFATESEANLSLAASMRKNAAWLLSEAERLEAAYGT